MKTSFRLAVLTTLLTSVLNLGCQGVGSAMIPVGSLTKTESSTNGDLVSTPINPANPDLSDNPSQPSDNDLDICSELSHQGVVWSQNLDIEDRRALLLALNISGSFEGHNGWANLTNNFDKMGLSMGLLNQTLGTGSLQPLLATFRRDYSSTYKSLLSSTQKAAMDKMLDAWIAAKGSSGFQKAFVTDALSDDELFVDTGVERQPMPKVSDVDPLQIDKFYALTPDFKAQDAATQASVTWALNTLYVPQSNKPNTSWSFKTEWSSALKNLAAHPYYVSLQIKAAERLHQRALSYQNELGFYQLRGYLMLFDITVQNGSLNDSDFTNFFNWLKANPNASQEQQMLKLIDIRAARSLAQYQEDVKSRKRAIVKGTGFVHGSQRKFASEYCFNPLITYPKTLN